MPLWNDNTPPTWRPDAKATNAGWEDPDTGEVLVAYGNLADTALAADINAVYFCSVAVDGEGALESVEECSTFVRGDRIAVVVRYNENVEVTKGAVILVSGTGSNDFSLYADAQSTNQVVFAYTSAGCTTLATVPNANTTLSITCVNPASAYITGTVTDTEGGAYATAILNITNGVGDGSTIHKNAQANGTVTINSVVYTFKADIANTVDHAGWVKLGESGEQSLANLAAAINADSSVSGVAYNHATEAHANVTAEVVRTAAGVAQLKITAKVLGTAANSYVVTETLTYGAWVASPMAGGAAKPASNKTITSAIATAAGTVDIPKATVETIAFGASSYARNDALTVKVTFDNPVDAAEDSNLTVTSTQNSSDITLYLASAKNADGDTVEDVDGVFEAVTELTFGLDDVIGEGEAVTIPSEAGVLGLDAPDITGDIYDSGTELAADVTCSSVVTKTIAAPVILDADFSSGTYYGAGPVSVTLTYDYQVDVVADGGGVLPRIQIYNATNSQAFYLYAAAQSNTTTVVFDKDSAGAAKALPVVDGVYSLNSFTVDTGHIYDGATTGIDAGKTITQALIEAAGTKTVTVPDIANEITFNAESYSRQDPVTVRVVYESAVDVDAGVKLSVTWNATTFIATTLAQTNVVSVEFIGAVPNEAGTMKLDAQTIDTTGGTKLIKIHGGTHPAPVTITQSRADHAGTIIVA